LENHIWKLEVSGNFASQESLAHHQGKTTIFAFLNVRDRIYKLQRVFDVFIE
jgi:hypothetical protein